MSINKINKIIEETGNVLRVRGDLEKRNKALEELETNEKNLESRIKMVNDYQKVWNYQSLVTEGIITEEEKIELEKLNEELRDPQQNEEVKRVVKKNLDEIESILQVKISEKEKEINERREKLKEKIYKHYLERKERIEKKISETEENPEIIKVLYDQAQAEMNEYFDKKEKEQQEFLKEINRDLQSLAAKNKNSIERLNEIVGEETFETLLGAFDSKDKAKIQSAFDKTRSYLKKAIIEGEGEKQIKNTKIIPWTNYSSVDYLEALYFLRNKENKEILRKLDPGKFYEIKKVIKEYEILYKLFGRKYKKDKKTGEKKLGWFAAALEERKKNDEDGTTKRNKEKKEKEEIERKKRKEEIEKILTKGGIKVPYKEKYIAILLEEKVSPKTGNTYLEITDAGGVTPDEKAVLIGKNWNGIEKLPDWIQKFYKEKLSKEQNN